MELLPPVPLLLLVAAAGLIATSTSRFDRDRPLQVGVIRRLNLEALRHAAFNFSVFSNTGLDHIRLSFP
jgi:hypothetical protein